MKRCALCLLLMLTVMVSSSGCDLDPPYTGSEEPVSVTSSTVVSAEPSSQEPVSVVDPYVDNPLTGLHDLRKEAADQRPIAVMINNIDTAQAVQTGLNEADIIFENLTEGGISRLMAFFTDAEQVGQFGTIRSLRYSFIDLAAGFDAIPVHNGADNVYATPHLRSLDLKSYDLITKGDDVSFREKNGKSYEHTLYSKGSMLWGGLQKSGIRLNWRENNRGPKVRFLAKDAAPAEGGQSCIDAKVVLSAGCKTNFRYNESDNTYTRCPKGSRQLDYKTDKPVTVTNVFVLCTTVSNFDDDYHTKTALEGGSGWYISQGKAWPITWEKGNASSPFAFYSENGSLLEVHPGRSWISLVSKWGKDQLVLTGVEEPDADSQD